MIHRFVATVSEEQHEIAVEQVEGDTYRITIDGRTRLVEARRVEGQAQGAWSLLPPGGGAARLCDVDGRAPDYTVALEGRSLPVKLVEGRRAIVATVSAKAQAAGPVAVRAPMPGKVVKVLVKAGEAVKAQQGLVVIEAMKMENELRASRDGTVADVQVAEGQAVEAGQVLATIG